MVMGRASFCVGSRPRRCVMHSSIFFAIAFALAGLLVVVVSVGRAEFDDLKRTRSVTCPETGHPARVGVDARQGAMSVTLGVPRLRILACSRWPERASCDQACREQIRGPGLFFAA
jgi:hypothetical protein